MFAFYSVRLHPVPAVEFASNSVAALTGHRPEDFYADPDLIAGLAVPDDRARLLALLGDASGVQCAAIRVRGADGSIVPTECRSVPVLDGDGRLAGVELLMWDAVAGALPDEVERAGEQRFRALVQHATDVVVVLDYRGRIGYASPSLGRHLGHEPAELAGSDLLLLVHPVDAPALRAALRDVAGTPGAHALPAFRWRRRDGEWRWIEGTATNRRDVESVRGVVLNLRDVTKRRAAERALEHSALHDPLTGLPNRDLFLDRLARALDRAAVPGSTVTVIVADLDRFKLLNDGAGLGFGDEVLRVVAERIRGVLRPPDTLARLGGDEFAICCEWAGDLGAATVADRVVECVAAPLPPGPGHGLVVTTSAGIAVGGAGASPELLLRDAETAMYRAKDQGGGRYEVFDEQVRSLTLERLRLERDLRAAVAAGDLRLAYQPVVDVRTGAVVGAEALVRWPHPERGLLGPGEFLPLADEVGLGPRIDRWALGEAVARLARWRDGSLPGLHLSVNLSGRQLSDAATASAVLDAVREAGALAGRLVIELTEQQLVQDPSAAALLDSLRSLGARVHLDDFGTGYSALSYLRELPVDAIKIDRRFVADLGAPGGAAIVAAIVAMARALDLEVVAEGVETPEQLAALKELGAGFVQGNHLGPPVDAEALEATVGRRLA